MKLTAYATPWQGRRGVNTLVDLINWLRKPQFSQSQAGRGGRGGAAAVTVAPTAVAAGGGLAPGGIPSLPASPSH